MAVGYITVLAVMVAIMSLENAARLASAVERTDTPLILLARLMATLVPEYLGIAIPVATYLATAIAVRSLSLRGEWQMFGALGISSARIMLTPMLLAAVAACGQLAVRLEFQPVGERSLDNLLGEIRQGLHGAPMTPGEVLTLSDGTTIVSDLQKSNAGVSLIDVFVRRGSDVVTARAATLDRDKAGGILLNLTDGVLIREFGRDRRGAVTFQHYQISVPAVGAVTPVRTDAERLDRLTTRDLVGKLRDNDVTWGESAKAASALGVRLSNAAFCLLLPWMGLAFGSPPRRRIGGAAILLGFAAIALFLRSSKLVEMQFLAAPLLAAVLHFVAWTGIAVAVVRYAQRREGAWDHALTRTLKLVRPSLEQ